MKVLIGTRNPHKLEEIRRILGDIPGIEWLTFREHPFPEVEETGTTLEENARLKAVSTAQATGLPTLAEDSGLEVAALGGAPGVLSSRFAGVEKDYRANNEKLLELLSGEENRRARFRAVAALALPDGRSWLTEGILEGEIATSPRGAHGFGYDPLFIPVGETRTLAELSPEEKDRISHRRRALERLRPLLSSLARGEL
ncbi:RdgB/HAM1 family non-canonical purine NTP pyrophosphatase [Candidatus Bipolaricaulota bacterium]|nr:RdgB/HAM1 family non-canonical purine NTP pyrophosphatase [Candidatus Bipolaricaulota bacterium]